MYMPQVSNPNDLADRVKTFEDNVDYLLADASALIAHLAAARAEAGQDAIATQRPMLRAQGLLQSLMDVRRKITGVHADLVKIAFKWDADTDCTCVYSPLMAFAGRKA